MRYLMLVCTETVEDQANAEADSPEEIDRWVGTHDASGARVWGDRLAEAGEARVVRVRGGRSTVEQGPLHEAHHAIAGLDILECDSLDQAVAIALDHPMARAGVIEVRPFYDWST